MRSRTTHPRPDPYRRTRDTVFTVADAPVPTWSSVRAQLDAGRWQRVGRALVGHNGPLTERERRQVALINCGSRAILTSFTAAAARGLEGWPRKEIHVLVPGGTHIVRTSRVRVQPHFSGVWRDADHNSAQRLHALAPALLSAAGSLNERAACAILAAAVQQKLVSAPTLLQCLAASPRQKHRRLLVDCCHDIGQGSHALSEIDFIRLCRRYKLPSPSRQQVRVEQSGRKRYLDAEWDCTDGRRVGVEVDGAMHLAPMQWYDDQMRQNELVIGGTTMLRYPSVVVRTQGRLVADQLRRALRLP